MLVKSHKNIKNAFPACTGPVHEDFKCGGAKRECVIVSQLGGLGGGGGGGGGVWRQATLGKFGF